MKQPKRVNQNEFLFKFFSVCVNIFLSVFGVDNSGPEEEEGSNNNNNNIRTNKEPETGRKRKECRQPFSTIWQRCASVHGQVTESVETLQTGQLVPNATDPVVVVRMQRCRTRRTRRFALRRPQQTMDGHFSLSTNHKLAAQFLQLISRFSFVLTAPDDLVATIDRFRLRLGARGR
jgi:hypothetical protein